MPDKKPASTVVSMTTILQIAGLVGVLYGCMRFIDSRIEHAINDEQLIKKIASHVRPYVVFDENGSVLVDGGAMQYLEEIEVGKLTEDDFTIEVTVTPKDHLANAPLIEALSKYEIFAVPERGRGHQWIYKMRIEVVRDSGRGEHLQPARFRLEILR